MTMASCHVRQTLLTSYCPVRILARPYLVGVSLLIVAFLCCFHMAHTQSIDNYEHFSQIASSVNISSPVTLEGSKLVFDSDASYYILNPVNTCSTISGDLFLLVYVHTNPTHFDRRKIIRETWGNVTVYQLHLNVIVRVVFIVGLSDDATNEALIREAEQYGDIIQARFTDTYRNLTFKATSALRWVTNYCSNTKYVLKTDDDIFVNMFSLIERLQGFFKTPEGSTKTIFCMVFYMIHAMREGKWEVSFDMYPEKIYPDFCSGSAFAMTTDAVVELYHTSKSVPFLPVDDVYVTGIVKQRVAGLRHHQMSSAYMLRDYGMEEKFLGQEWYNYLFCQMRDITSIHPIWNKLVNLALPAKEHQLLPT